MASLLPRHPLAAPSHFLPTGVLKPPPRGRSFLASPGVLTASHHVQDWEPAREHYATEKMRTMRAESDPSTSLDWVAAEHRLRKGFGPGFSLNKAVLATSAPTASQIQSGYPPGT